jgi:hypothetical protein
MRHGISKSPFALSWQDSAGKSKTLHQCRDSIILHGESKTMPTLSKQVIEAAIEGFEGQKLHIDAQIAELRAMLNGGPATPVTKPKPATATRKMSPAALRRMREGQKRRWAKAKAEPAAPLEVVSKASKPKRKLSAAGKAAIVAALKKRWAAKRAAAGETKSAAVAQKTGRKKAA